MAISSDKKRQLVKKALIEALSNSLGNVSEACKQVGVSRNAYYEYLKHDPKFAESVANIEESNLDLVEGKLLELIQGLKMLGEGGAIYQTQPNVTAAIFYLKTKGKKRGYIERVETQLSGELAVTQEQLSWFTQAITVIAYQKNVSEAAAATGYLKSPQGQNLKPELRAAIQKHYKLGDELTPNLTLT